MGQVYSWHSGNPAMIPSITWSFVYCQEWPWVDAGMPMGMTPKKKKPYITYRKNTHYNIHCKVFQMLWKVCSSMVCCCKHFLEFGIIPKGCAVWGWVMLMLLLWNMCLFNFPFPKINLFSPRPQVTWSALWNGGPPTWANNPVAQLG